MTNKADIDNLKGLNGVPKDIDEQNRRDRMNASGVLEDWIIFVCEPRYILGGWDVSVTCRVKRSGYKRYMFVERFYDGGKAQYCPVTLPGMGKKSREMLRNVYVKESDEL